MCYEIVRSVADIDEALGRCFECVDAGNTKYPGMSYEEGWEAAIDWLTNKGVYLDEVL